MNSAFLSENSSAKHLLLALLLFLLTTALYLPALQTGFLNLDDPDYVQLNSHVNNGLTLEGIKAAFTVFNREYWIPVLFISYMVDVEIFGTDPWGFHLVNILLHAANCALLFLIFWSVTKALTPCFFAAALFAFHPLRVESVAWISQRKDVLSALFFLLAMWAYFRYADRKERSFYWFSLLLLLIGLMTKPILITFPFLILLLDIWPLKRLAIPVAPLGQWFRSSPGIFMEKIPFMVLGLVFSLVTLVNQRYALHGLYGPSDLFYNILKACTAPVIYLRDTVFPVGLAVIPHAVNWNQGLLTKGVLSGSILTILITICITRRKTQPYLLVSCLWFLIALFPVSGIIGVGSQWLSDRFTYIPAMGLSMGISWVIFSSSDRTEKRKILIPVSILILVLLFTAARRQLGHWETPVTLWSHSTRVAPDNPYTHFYLGGAYVQMNDPDRALQSIEKALKLEPEEPEIQGKFGMMLVDRGQVAEGHSYLEKSVAADPNNRFTRGALGFLLLEQMNRPREAVPHLEAFLQLTDSDSIIPEVHNGLGQAYALLGSHLEALDHFTQAIEIAPAFNSARFNLALSFSTLGRSAEAVVQFREILTRSPDDIQVRLNLAENLRGLGSLQEAEAQYLEVSTKVPDTAEGHFARGRLLEIQNRDSEAEIEYRKGLTLAEAGSEMKEALMRALP